MLFCPHKRTVSLSYSPPLCLPWLASPPGFRSPTSYSFKPIVINSFLGIREGSAQERNIELKMTQRETLAYSEDVGIPFTFLILPYFPFICLHPCHLSSIMLSFAGLLCLGEGWDTLSCDELTINLCFIFLVNLFVLFIESIAEHSKSRVENFLFSTIVGIWRAKSYLERWLSG